MVLEATLICMDNSEWMRNGDYPPSRLDAQNDAVNIICGAKIQAHPENTVGLLSTAGASPQVVVTPTQDAGQILTSLHTVQLGGEANLTAALRVAQLALKHRQNKHQRQRIILFVGSPVKPDAKALASLGAKLKKNSVAVDVVSFGEEAENTEKLESFINAVNNSDNSHLVTIPPGPHVLSSILMQSPVLRSGGEEGEPSAGGAGGADGGSGFQFDVDPNIDPELALALRISLEEARAQQEREARAAQDAAGDGEAQAATGTAATPPGEGEPTTPAPDAAAAPAAPAHMEVDEAAEAGGDDGSDGMDEDEMLRQAVAMSMGAGDMGLGDGAGDDDGGMDEDMQRALAMSMEEAEAAVAGEAPSSSNDAPTDAALLSSVLSSLPGVDMNDERIKEVLGGSGDAKKSDADKDKKDD
eukprot:Rmarinus@m.2106